MIREVESIAWQGSVPVEFAMEGDEVNSFFPPTYTYVSFNLSLAVTLGIGLSLGLELELPGYG